MARKRKPLTATKLVKAQARDVVGSPKPSHVLPDRRADADRKKTKHKKREHEQITAE